MSDTPTGNAQPMPVPAHPPFPAVRLLWAFGYAFLAWCVFWTVLVLALVQFVMIGVNGKAHDDLKHFSLNLIQYLWELLAYVTLVRDEQPFPVGPFPKSASV
jgi:hypothetical protein